MEDEVKEPKRHNLLVTSCPCENWCSLDGVLLPDAEAWIDMTRDGTFATIRLPVDLVADIKPDQVNVARGEPVNARELEQKILDNPPANPEPGWLVRAVLESQGIEAE
ncbi:MAG: hypothetical protein SPK50_02920 [Mobiluncus porci]|uniref:hypothetical protein n=1 Tax=Mobiluncus porci TaxID=2652278 RepID=UPI0023F2D151|nr:hypothetical protein [Mobiluncus porci]MDD7541180.1 hypothetical protein [Mobiluncus porci]MDY5748069.1 hypothetical protein [Mobiluncus porci]